MNAIIAICSEEYLSYYRVLYQSLKKYAPTCEPILYFIGTNVPTNLGKVVDISSWDTIYENRLTHICSLRSRVVLDAFDKGYEKVIFSGAKVEFFAEPSIMLDALDDHNAVLTPHITSPLPEDGLFPSNASVSFTGHISTDLVGFSKSEETIEFLTWQDTIMKTNCSTTGQTYLDQSWLNFAPFILRNTLIFDHPGYNVAYWNFTQRNFRKVGDQFQASGNGWLSNPIVCFQYSGLPLSNPERISTHQNRWKASGDFLEFLTSYADRVKNG